MAVIHLASLHEAAKQPLHIILPTLCFTLIWFLYCDFASTYLKRPSHFVRKRLLDFLFKPKFDAPLVELRPGETYREVLARDSAMVGTSK